MAEKPCEQRLEGRPGLSLSGVREQVHDHGSLLDRRHDVEQVGTGDPAVLDGLLPGGTVLAHANNHIEPVVA
jgi:hypothetical protein